MAATKSHSDAASSETWHVEARAEPQSPVAPMREIAFASTEEFTFETEAEALDCWQDIKQNPEEYHGNLPEEFNLNIHVFSSNERPHL